jgi:hypothetical protein
MEPEAYLMNERRLKYLEIGIMTKVLLDLHLENPTLFKAEKVINELVKEYEKLGLEKEMEDEEY